VKFVGIGPVWKRFSGEMIDMNTLNEYVDFWYYEIGVNPIPAITTNKQTGKSPHPFGILHYEWNDASYNLRDDPIPEELFQHLKSENHYNQGIAIAGGLIHRGIHQGRYLILVDADNQKGIERVFPKGLKSLKANTLVEQHKDRPDKLHAYFITNKPITSIPATDKPDGIQFEVKSESKKGVHFVSPSLHKDGERYEIVSECKKPVYLFDENISKFETHLLKLAGSEGETKKSVKEIHENKSIKTKGDGGGFDLLRTLDSWKIKNPELTEPMLTVLAKEFTKEHHDPVCSDEKIEGLVKQAMGYGEKIIEERGFNETQQKKIDENWKIIQDSLSTKTEIKKAKKSINEIHESAEVKSIDWNEYQDDEESIYKQVTSILNTKIKRTIISENNKSRVIVLIEQGNHVEALDLESVRFRQLLQVIVSKDLGLEPIDKEEHDKIISQLIANAQIDGIKIEKTFNRIQSDEKRIVIDLGNDNFECVEITKDEIEIKTLDEYSPILLRYQTTHTQVKPEYGYATVIKEFAELLNFKDIQLFAVHLVAMFLADVTTPIMALTGKAGSQKTTTSAAIKRIIDPAGDSLEANVLSIPTARDDIIMTLYNRYLTVFENVSKIDTDTSDILCRGVTGSSNTKRAHYKNLEEIIMTFKRKMILNGVTPNFNNGDLQTRLVKYSKKEEFTFLTDSEFEEKFVTLRPKVLGQIFEVLQRVLGRIDGFKIIAKTRMAEFERWGELISQELGYDADTFGDKYEDKMKITSIENKDAHPIIGIIENIMSEKVEYEDTVSNLYDKVKTQAIKNGIDPKDRYVSFPKASNQLIDRMTDVATIFDNLDLKFTTWNNTDNDPKYTKKAKIIKITNLNLKPKETHMEKYQK
jgi:hypothetical protein